MNEDMIIISEYCSKSDIELSFLVMLEEAGLIEIVTMEEISYIPLSQLPELERYARMYYDLSINVEGIDVIDHLLSRIRAMEEQMHDLRCRLDTFRSGVGSSTEII